MKKAILVILTLLLAVLPAALPSFAAEPTIDELQKEIQKYQHDLGRLRKQQADIERRIAETRRRDKTVLQQLGRLERQIDVTTGKLRQAQDYLAAAERRLAAAADALDRAEKELTRRTDLMNRRVKAIYENGSVTYLDVLLSATSFSDFLNRFDALRTIAAADIRLFQDVKSMRAQVAELKVRREAERAKALSVKVQVEQTKLELEEQKGAKERLHRELQSKEAEYEKALDELEATSRQVEGMLRRLEKELEKRLKKEGAIILSRPLTGAVEVTSPFGDRFHPIIRQWRLHTGVDYGASYGTPVHASEEGIVLHAGWLGGYGKAVIIVHGKQVSTLYAHLSEIEVAPNQRVKKGEVIGRVGSTGFSTGPHLHWEVRIDGVPRNPAEYLNKPIH